MIFNVKKSRCHRLLNELALKNSKEKKNNNNNSDVLIYKHASKDFSENSISDFFVEKYTKKSSATIELSYNPIFGSLNFTLTFSRNSFSVYS